MLFMKLMKDGGPVMWIILALDVIALAVVLKKTLQFHREEISVRELLRGIFNVLRRHGFIEAVSLCDNTPGPVARMLSAAIAAKQQGDEDIRSAIDDAAFNEIPRLERGMKLLGTIGFILPLVGFLGTVVGMLQAFEVVRASEFLSASAVSGAVTSALITSAAGLAGAIPCYVAYNYLLSRIDTITLEMDRAAIEIISFFERENRKEETED
ncbi:MAG: MotA/TolQ/ExbB proton channel family protein [Lentisphaeria bacterium]|nr:MotA/TolQ/ExbB proton channel family protein [Lentisphaeria bacterium]